MIVLLDNANDPLVLAGRIACFAVSDCGCDDWIAEDCIPQALGSYILVGVGEWS